MACPQVILPELGHQPQELQEAGPVAGPRAEEGRPGRHPEGAQRRARVLREAEAQVHRLGHHLRGAGEAARGGDPVAAGGPQDIILYYIRLLQKILHFQIEKG